MILVQGPSSVKDDSWVGGLDHPEDGVVSVAPRPGSHALWSLASEVLAHLGQVEMPLGATEHDRRLLSIWIEAHALTDIIVNHAEHYPVEVLEDFDSILGVIGVRVWLLVNRVLLPGLMASLEPAALTEMPWAAFVRHWTDRSVGFTEVPSHPAILADAPGAWELQHARLEAVAGRRLGLPYLEGFCAIANAGRDARPGKITITVRLRSTLEAYSDSVCFAQAVRGATVALRVLGWEVGLDLRRLAGHSAELPLMRPADAIELEDLRLFRSPRSAAIATLTSLRLAPHEIIDLQIKDVAVDGSTIQLWHDAVPVPSVARPMLRAQRIERMRDGATSEARYLVDRGRQISVRRFASMVIAALEEVGRYIPWDEVRDRPAEDERWLLERGVAIRWLPGRERVPRRRTDAFDPDPLVREALERLGATTVHASGEDCRCTAPHVAPELLNRRFGVRPHAAPAATHPWKWRAGRDRPAPEPRERPMASDDRFNLRPVKR